MFTGIIKSIESVTYHEDKLGLTHLTLSRKASFFHEVQIDDSIAINGACLTVVSIDDECVQFDILPETLRKTNLESLKEGDQVNVEPALRAGDFMGGHNVQGHIDTTAYIQSIECDGAAVNVTFSLDQSFGQQNTPKGFIAIDGISLTLTKIKNDSFSVMLIPHTWNNTCAQFWKIGQSVNIEIDMIAKTIFNLLKNLRG